MRVNKLFSGIVMIILFFSISLSTGCVKNTTTGKTEFDVAKYQAISSYFHKFNTGLYIAAAVASTINPAASAAIPLIQAADASVNALDTLVAQYSSGKVDAAAIVEQATAVEEAVKKANAVVGEFKK